MLKDYNPNDRAQIKFHVTYNLLQPMSHIARSTGNEAELKTQKTLDLEGNQSDIYLYSGNAQRNGKTGRRSGMLSFFDSVDLDLLKPEHQIFFCGGYLDGGGSSNLDWENKIRKYFPYLSLLGTAVPAGSLGSKGSSMIHGRIAFGSAYLVCYESLEYLYRLYPPAIEYKYHQGIKEILDNKTIWIKELNNSHFENRKPDTNLHQQYQDKLKEWLPLLQEGLKTASQHIELLEKPRMDSLKDPSLSKYLRDDTPVLKGQTSLFGDTEKPSKEKEKETKIKASGQMISGTWTIQQGSQLYAYWSSTGAGITQLEEGALIDALLKFGEAPYLGGMSGSGCGLCSMDIWYQTPSDHGKWLTIAPNGVQDLSDRAAESHARYKELLALYRKYFDEVKAGKTVDSQELRDLLIGGK